MTNAAYAKGSFNNNPISSPLTVALVRYKQPIQKKEHNGDRDNYDRPGYGGYGGTTSPCDPCAQVPVISGSPMYCSVPDGYGSELNVYTSGPSTT